MMRWALRLSGALVAALLCVSGMRAQQPTFRSATALVQVDAVVLDREGRFIEGLRPEDVTIFEDGKPQRIEQFYLVKHDPVARASMIAAEARGRPAEAAHRLFILVFDEAHLSSESLMRLRTAAASFIMKEIGPGDVAGVFVNGELYQGRITTDKGALLAGVRAAAPAVENRHTLLAAFREFPRVPSEHDALRITEGARELAERLAADACRAEPVLCEIDGFSEGVQRRIEQKSRFYVRSARTLADRTAQTIAAISDGLARFAGRKTLVLLSDGFFSEDARSSIERVAGRAARAGVTVYSIDGRGLTPASGTSDVLSTGRARSTVFDSGEEGPAILSDRTGGLVVRGIDDMDRAFDMIARDTSTYYVIGYSPTDARTNGKFRKIEVKTSAEGATVRARKGYLATPLPQQESFWK